MEWVVAPQDSGAKLIAFLQSKLKISTKQIKRALDQGYCQINGRVERFGKTILGTSDLVVIHHPAIPSSKKLSFDPERILYEDEKILAYNKPAGLISDPSTVLKIFKPYCPSLQLIHRLDKGTTGVLLFGKTQDAIQRMEDLFRSQLIHKTYLAIIDGVPSKKEGTIESYLGKLHTFEGQSIFGSVDQKKGLHAITQWKKLANGPDASLIQCFPKTGRTHQIRVHLSEMGHPILGDFQYGKKFICKYHPKRYLLHASEISFVHPFNKIKIKILAPLPEDFSEALIGTIPSYRRSLTVN